MRHRYGIDHAGYAALLTRQDGRCAVCRELPVSDVNMPKHWNGILCVDHDHATGVVRGLLCNDCNLMLKRGAGSDRLRAAADYLDRYNRQGDVG